MKGRKPKPAGIRALHGSRTRAHHHDEPPPPDDGKTPSPIKPPTGLVKSERRYWNQFAPLLRAARVLTPADVETLADYCRACAAVVDRSRRLRLELARRRSLDRGFVSLLDRQLRGWLERKTKLAGELGLTAISRTRIAWTGHRLPGDTPPTPERSKTKLAQLQERAAALRRPVGVK